MALRYHRTSLHAHILAVMDETGQENPFSAVRVKAAAVVAQFHRAFGAAPPFNMQAIASLRGLHWSNDDPRYSADSEIAPEGDGRVALRINKDRPLSRQRFSIGHEVGHTLFPEFQLAVRCRKAVDRSWADPDDLLETLCDVAASELLFPAPWFSDRVAGLTLTAASVAELANDFQASRDATIRRFVELHAEPLAAVFFQWKLKPVQERALTRSQRQRALFPGMPLLQPQPMLRVDYAILSASFEKHCADHIPKHKSIPSHGPIYTASVSQTLQDGECVLDLGTVTRRFAAHILPVFTPEDRLGPDGECSVVALLRPV